MRLHGEQPQQRVVDDRIDVRAHRLGRTEGDQRAPLQRRVRRQIAVHKQALVRVAAPYPFVTLDTVEHERPAAQGERVRRDREYAVQLRVVALKLRDHGDVDVLVDRPDGVVPDGAVRDERVSQRLPGAAARHGIGRAAIIAPDGIKRLRPGFAEIHRRRGVADDLERRRQLGLKAPQHAAVHRFDGYRLVNPLRVRPVGRVAAGIRKIAVVRRGDGVCVVILHEPADVRADDIARDEDRRHTAHAADVNVHAARSGGARDGRAEGVLPAVELYIADRARDGIDREYGIRRERIAAPEDDTLAEALALPEGGPAHAAFHTGKVLLQRVIALKIAGIPEPAGVVGVHRAAPPFRCGMAGRSGHGTGKRFTPKVAQKQRNFHPSDENSRSFFHILPEMALRTGVFRGILVADYR